MKFVEKDICTGCSACVLFCSARAISMKTDVEGFIFPFINKNNCIDCGMCASRCPVIKKNINREYNMYPQAAYAAINKNERIRLESSSGGIFTLLAEEIITSNGIVFGATFDESFNVVHRYTESIEGLAAFRGSKYVQSNIEKVYKQCESYLSTGRKVLFSGTPCQVAGLKSYLNMESDSLFCIDFICHGVPSPLVWKKYIQFRERSAGSKVQRIAFRQKNDGWKLYSVLFVFENNTEYSVNLKHDPYLQLYLRNVMLRPSCYNCSFKSRVRESDITLADFWGVERLYPDIFDDKGISLVFINTKKGKNLLDNISTRCFIKNIDADLAIEHNKAMIQSVRKPQKRNIFFDDLCDMPFEKVIKKYASDGIGIKTYKYIRNTLSKTKQLIRNMGR